MRSNIKLLNNIPIEDEPLRLQEADGLSLESSHKTKACAFLVMLDEEERKPKEDTKTKEHFHA